MEMISTILKQAREYLNELPVEQRVITQPAGEAIAAWIDHTLLKPDARADQIKALCTEAHQYQFATVCVNPVYVPLASGLLKDSKVGICTVVGFPLGASLPTHKTFETLSLLEFGATEIDMVINIGALKSEAYGLVLNDMLGVVQVAHNQQAIVKVIIETALLTRAEKIIACLLAKAAGLDYVKTSTGFASGGATAEDVELMSRVAGPGIKVKASGGIRSLADARAMIQAGAERIGTSAGVKILQEAKG